MTVKMQKKVRRDVFERYVRSHHMVAKTSYRYDGRNVTGVDTPGNDWLPVRIKENAGDWQAGYFNLADFWFKRGSITALPDGSWEIWFGDEGILIKDAPLRYTVQKISRIIYETLPDKRVVGHSLRGFAVMDGTAVVKNLAGDYEVFTDFKHADEKATWYNDEVKK